MTASAPKPPFTITGRHVLIGTCLFFGVVIGIDALFTAWAVQTFPGEVSKTAYEDGLAYNRRLEARAVQARLGWSASVVQAAAPGAIAVRLADAGGRPLDGLKVAVTLVRPATDSGETSVVLAADGPGLYAGVAPVAAGTWDLTVRATDPGGRLFEAERRLTWR